MKYIWILAISFIFILSIFFTGCFQETVSGDGSVSTVNYNFNNFKEVNISYGCMVEMGKSDSYSIEISIDENLQRYLKVYTSNNVLYIGMEEGRNYENSHFKANIKLPDVYTIGLSGGSRLNLNEGFDFSHSMDYSFSGGSTLNGKINSRSSIIHLSGGSRITLAGGCNDLEINSSGGSTADLFPFISNNCNIDASGGSIISVFVNNELGVSASGGSRIKYKGNARISSSDLSGGSQIIKL